MNDIQLVQSAINAGGVAVGLIVLWFVNRELLRMINKMLDTQTDLIDKLGDMIAENQQTYYRVRELIEEQRKNPDGRFNKQHDNS